MYDLSAYYNVWRLRAVLLLVEAYHYEALAKSSGASPSNVCVDSKKISYECGQAAEFALRYYGPSKGNSNSGLFNLLLTIGHSVQTPSWIPFVPIKIVSGLPKPNPILVANVEVNSIALPPFNSGSNTPTYFEWTPAVSAWSTEIPNNIGPPFGYATTRFATVDDGQTIGSTVVSGQTYQPVMTALSAVSPPYLLRLPLASSLKSIWIEEFTDGIGEECLIYNFNPFIAPPGGVVCYGLTNSTLGIIVSEGEFGPYTSCAQATNPPSICSSIAGKFPPDISWQGGGEHSPLVVTDASGCPNGESGLNTAGWLKPCGEGWVQQIYKDDLPSAATLSALKNAANDLAQTGTAKQD